MKCDLNIIVLSDYKIEIAGLRNLKQYIPKKDNNIVTIKHQFLKIPEVQ